MMNARVKMLNRCVASLCKTRKLEKAEAVVVDGIVSGKLVDDVAAYNTLIDANCELGRFDVASDLVEEMKNTKISSDLIGGATKRYLPVMYNSLKSGNPYSSDENSSSGENLNNGPIICNTVVKLLFRCKRYHKRGLEFISTMRSNGFRLDGSAYCTVIRGLVKAGSMKEANVFKEQMMSDGNIHLDLVCYNTLLRLYYKQGDFEAAVDVLEDIKRAGLEPDRYTHPIMINALCKTSGTIDEAIAYFLKYSKVGFLTAFNCLLDCMCKHGHIELAMKFFETGKDDADYITYTTMVHHLCKAGRFVCASKLLSAFIEDGIKKHIKQYCHFI